MADESGEGARQPQPDLRQDRGGCGAVHTRLSLLAPDTEGSGGGADLWSDGEPMEIVAPLRNENGRRRAESGGGEPHQNADAGDGGGLRGSDDGDGKHGKGRGAQLLPPIGKIDSAEFKNVAFRHRQEIGEATPADSEIRLRDGNSLLPDKLEKATNLALDYCAEILKEVIPAKKDPAFAVVLRAKGVAAQTVVTLFARTNDTALKRETLNEFADLIRIIQEEKLKLISQ